MTTIEILNHNGPIWALLIELINDGSVSEAHLCNDYIQYLSSFSVSRSKQSQCPN